MICGGGGHVISQEILNNPLYTKCGIVIPGFMIGSGFSTSVETDCLMI